MLWNPKIALRFVEMWVSLTTACFAVRWCIPYFGLGPIPWWQAILRWPWQVAYGIFGSQGSGRFVVLTMFTLFVIYSVVCFLMIRSLVVRPVFERV